MQRLKMPMMTYGVWEEARGDFADSFGYLFDINNGYLLGNVVAMPDASNMLNTQPVNTAHSACGKKLSKISLIAGNVT